MFNENDVITNGTDTGTVLFSSTTFVVVETASGEAVLDADALGGWALAAEEYPAFRILHPFCVYRLDGTRVDGYADKDRAIRRNKKRFPNGFMLFDADTAELTLIS